MQSVAEWMVNYGLELATNKTETAIFTKRRAYRTLRVDIGGYPVLIMKSVKYLRVTLNSRLSFTRYMVEIVGKCTVEFFIRITC